MKKVELIEIAVARHEKTIEELIMILANAESCLRTVKLLRIFYEEEQRLDNLVHFCVNGEYPDE